MKKLLVILMLAVMACSACAPAFAVEPDESTSEPSETITEPSEAGSDELLDCSEEDTPSLFSEGDEMPTVNISDESIEAIANAVNSVAVEYQYAYQYTISFTTSDGSVETWTIDTNEEALLEEYDVALTLYASRRCLNINGTYTGGLDGTNPSYSGLQIEAWKSSTAKTFAFDTVASLSIGTNGGAIMWSNFHVFNSDGTLIYESEHAKPVVFTISFDTGFDDLTLDPQQSDSLVLPSLTKAGYAFLGWYLDPGFDTVFNLSSHDWISNITLYAKWEEEPPMAFFSGSVFQSMTTLFEVDAVFYVVALMGMVVILGILRTIIKTRF